MGRYCLTVKRRGQGRRKGDVKGKGVVLEVAPAVDQKMVEEEEEIESVNLARRRRQNVAKRFLRRKMVSQPNRGVRLSPKQSYRQVKDQILKERNLKLMLEVAVEVRMREVMLVREDELCPLAVTVMVVKNQGQDQVQGQALGVGQEVGQAVAPADLSPDQSQDHVQSQAVDQDHDQDQEVDLQGRDQVQGQNQVVQQGQGREVQQGQDQPAQQGRRSQVQGQLLDPQQVQKSQEVKGHLNHLQDLEVRLKTDFCHTCNIEIAFGILAMVVESFLVSSVSVTMKRQASHIVLQNFHSLMYIFLYKTKVWNLCLFHVWTTVN